MIKDDKQDGKIKCYIYGAGNEYNRLCSYLGAYKEKLEIIGIITTEKQKFSSLDNIPCSVINDVNIGGGGVYDYIIIAVRKWKEIAEILKKYGVSEQRWIRSDAFYYPNFDLYKYIQLKKSNVSILSNFCMGGHVYRELGLGVLSPTINMFCLGRDYLEFLRNYEYYLNMDMQPYCEDSHTYISGTLNRESYIPKGIIDSRVIWYFNHNDDAKSAVYEWNYRRKRVNFSNIAAIMTIHTDEEAYEFERLNIEKKIGVYYRNLHLKSVIYCPEWEDNDKLRHEYDFNWAAYANHYMCNCTMLGRVDWLKFLNGEKGYIRY